MTLDYFKQKYGHEVEGLWVPRVTAVTGFVSKGNGFWNRGSADWGTLVHQSVASLLKGEKGEPQESVMPSIQAFSKWQKAHHFEIESIEEVEKKVFDRENLYAGTVDIIGRVKGKKGIIDLKTSSEIRQEHSLQTAAYFAAYNSGSTKEKCETRWILRIEQYEECKGCFAKKKTKVSGGNPFCNHVWGGPKSELEFKELENQAHDLEAFLSAKELWEWYNREWLNQIPNYPKKLSQKVLI
ncbi:MAG: hypothetical protein A2842_00580 [Candidatus Wildermuthbacteria bacterium RIFCSPHIGHO2_01_FULL_48_25]|uniref:PD-(D/E)XK endonuclease-like domain-containing protein n=1 Tax=Candidatus Wildermuthbacteria bacterium RIFCSPLOWO2_01_FULL_48_16 TaxID=1802461 RepID=A0A1G2RL11_9BACT|nr:MAG: hypothetical protein A2842_00580 [Candidatus Wildermuthbacteria bacterium RIFCSPHIGHO2_01_FULL_48_25]OHA68432.1 MAG: hypothetical protein A3J57_01055 [Candidatus Wildermuthbacteria bacterium RIFCSPHIGHO2_02_FULL_49_12b]OHA73049.1 MAG: hypothetical protein A3B24_01390 [Candidatus Wildermuthbacteria bacterium RIFCSPLOWO2_01_FULL_48_16]